MKDQYFGDARDYLKYHLLEELHRRVPGITRLVAFWMLTPPDGTGEGNIPFVEAAELPELTSFLKKRLRGERKIACLQEYFCKPKIEYMPIGDSPPYFTNADRDTYFARPTREDLQNAIVFFDPDNGLKSRPTPRHVTFVELRAVFERSASNSVFVVYQHFHHRPNFVEYMATQIEQQVGAAAGCVSENSVALYVIPKSTEQIAGVNEALESVQSVAMRTRKIRFVAQACVDITPSHDQPKPRSGAQRRSGSRATLFPDRTANLLYSTVRIMCLEPKPEVGTSFFFEFSEPRGGRTMTVLVTARHVVEECTKAELFVHTGMEDGSGQRFPSGSTVKVIVDNFKASWIHHPDRNVDLCAMPMRFIDDAARQNGHILYYQAMPESTIATDEFLLDRSGFEDVVMVGYPIGLWDEPTKFPIVRKGIAATHPSIDYMGRAEGLVDIATLKGSSGSPVLWFPANRNGTARLIGVNYMTPPHLVSGDLVFGTSTKSTAKVLVEYPVHLGVYIKARRLWELRDEILRVYKRAEYSVAPS